MYPEVERFIAAMSAAEKAEADAFSAAYAAYDAKLAAADVGGHVWSRRACPACNFRKGPAGAERQAATQASWDAFHAAQTAAWAALAKSADPLVRWIAENCQGYEEQAQDLLRLLPVPLEALDEFAYDQGWCGVWDRLRKAAEEAGVLPAATAAPAESEVSA